MLVAIVVLLVICFVVWKKFFARKLVTVSGQQLGSSTPRMSRGGSYRGVVGGRVDYAKQARAAAAETAAQDEQHMRIQSDADNEAEDDTADDEDEAEEDEEEEEEQQQPQRQPASSRQQQQQQQVKRPI